LVQKKSFNSNSNSDNVAGPRLLVGGVAVRGLRLRAVGDVGHVGDADPQRGRRHARHHADAARVQRHAAVLQRGGGGGRHLRPLVPAQRGPRRRRVDGGRVRRRRAEAGRERDAERVALLQVRGVRAAPRRVPARGVALEERHRLHQTLLVVAWARRAMACAVPVHDPRARPAAATQLNGVVTPARGLSGCTRGKPMESCQS
jgi:hypothetical protein